MYPFKQSKPSNPKFRFFGTPSNTSTKGILVLWTLGPTAETASEYTVYISETKFHSLRVVESTAI